MALQKIFRNRKEALFYKKITGTDAVQCTLCPKYCFLQTGEIGKCGVRSNRGGVLYSLNYGWIRALNMENIEKIPLVEYYNTMNVLAVGSWGCNMQCDFCNSLQLIDGVGTGRVLYPNEVAEIADKLAEKDNIGVAYAFGEPAVWYEYVLETCQEVKKTDLKNILSTNGYLNPEPLKRLLLNVDAVNLDIKSMDPAYYEQLGGDLMTVLASSKIIKSTGVHLEISRVMIPGVNDTKQDIEELVRFVRDELGRAVPLHLLEHIPNGKVKYPRTSEDDLVWAADLADEYLENVYIGTP